MLTNVCNIRFHLEILGGTGRPTRFYSIVVENLNNSWLQLSFDSHNSNLPNCPPAVPAGIVFIG